MFGAVRDVELYRRPPFLTGDEVVVSKWKRHWRRLRLRIKIGFLVGIVALGAGLTYSNTTSPALVIGGFSALTMAFIVTHLWAGARMWMGAMTFYEDGIVGMEMRFFLCHTRFAIWREIESVDLVADPDGGKRVVVRRVGAGPLRSIPGEVSDADFEKVKAKVAVAKAAIAEGGAVANP